MDNKELEDILKSKFASLRAPLSAPSLVPEIMQRVTETEPAGRRRHEWLLVLGRLLGAVVCFTGWQGFDPALLLEGFSFAAFGAYEQPAAQAALALIALGLGAPLLYVAVQD